MIIKFFQHISSVILAFVIIIFFLALDACAITKKNNDLQNTVIEVKIANNGSNTEEEKAVLELKVAINDIANDFKKSLDTDNIQNSKLYYAETTKQSIIQLLDSEGYYANEVDFFIENNNKNIITYEIKLHERYDISNIKIVNDKNNKTDISLIDLDKLNIKRGDYAIAEDIINAAKIIHKKIEDEYCLIKLSIKHEVILDHINKTVEIKYVIFAGAEGYVKDITLAGLKSLKSNYVRKIIPIKDGQCFKQKIISNAITILQKSGLFLTIKPIIPISPDLDGNIPIQFQLKERKHRTIKTGLRYDTDLGIGVKLGLEHRNVFGSAENFEISIFGNQKEQSVEGVFTKPFFLHEKQTLILSSSAIREDNKSYESDELVLYAGIDRYLTDNIAVSVGNQYSYNKVKEHDTHNTLTYDSFPIHTRVDTRNNILNPSKGHLFKITLEPTFNLSSKNKNQNNNFTVARILGTAYINLAKDESSIIAFKATIASIFGAKVEKIPANKRLYVGGAGSIRGYQSKFIGHNHNIVTDNLYGKSSLETSIELRQKITKNIGIVLFLDSGQSYGNTLPKIHDKLLYGAGVGLRYYTGFAPIRADIAFPINRDKKKHKSWQLYVGIGQSF